MPIKRDELERVIDDVTVDCYNDDEAATAFCTAIDEHLAEGPVAARLAGIETEIATVDYGNERRGITANIRHGGRTYEVALLDLAVDETATPELFALLAAYRHWCDA